MVKRFKLVLILSALPFMFSSWGFYGHKRINRMAVFTLPPEMIGFYKQNIEYLTHHSIDPDKRRYASKDEAPRHYIDIDYYAKAGESPFDIMPRKWNEAVEKFSEDTLKAYGIVPWHIQSMLKWLSNAFEERNVDKILSLSADLGHYVADAHVPLHTTMNYNGQLTNQKGIHGLWESRIPELMADKYDYFVGRASYLKNPLKTTWEIIEESHWYLDSVLLIEKKLTEEFSTDKKYAFEQKGTTTSKQYSRAYALAYNERMGDMVESRMRKAVSMVSNFWYTAWVNAGQPDLNQINKKLPEESISDTDQKPVEGLEIKGRVHE